MTIQVHQFLCLSDNFGYLVHDVATGATASIDAPDGARVLAALTEKSWTLTDILVTHHHPDHVQGIAALKERFPKARVTGPKKESARIAGLEREVVEDDVVKVGASAARVIETPGHTAGHIVYYFADDDVLFSGDTLFSLGCGRVFETPMGVMYDSLCKLAALPPETQIYCGHEYTVSNAKFALAIEPQNAILVERARQADALRAESRFTIPTTLALELAANPFLRAEEPDVQNAVGLPNGDQTAVFAELRERKNKA